MNREKEIARGLVFLALTAVLVTTGCGGGGSGGAGAGAPGVATSSAVSGRVYTQSSATGAIQGIVGASVQAYADRNLSIPIAGANAETATAGNFSMSVADTAIVGLTEIYFRSTSGTVEGTGLPGPTLTGVISITASGTVLSKTDNRSNSISIEVALSILSSLIVKITQQDPSATPASAKIQVAAIFGLGSADIKVNDIKPTSAEKLIAIATVLVEAAAAQNQTLDQYTTKLSTSISSGDSAFDKVIQELIDGQSNAPIASTLTIAKPSAFEFTQLTLTSATGTASQEFNMDTVGIKNSGSGERTLVLTCTTQFTGHAVPTIRLRMRNLSEFKNERFEGNLNLAFFGQAPDKRKLSLTITPIVGVVSATGNTGSLTVPQTAKLVASGTDADGNVATTIEIPNLLERANIDLFEVTALTGGQSEIRFGSAAIAEAIRFRLRLGVSTHPVSLLEATGTFDPLLTIFGLPAGTVKGRVTNIRLGGLQISQ